MDKDGNGNEHLNIVTGGSDLRQRPPQVKTRDEAKKYITHSLDLLRHKRADCDIQIPDNPQATAVAQEKAFRKMLLHIGVVMGSSAAFYSVGLLDDVAYDLFHQEALQAMAGRLVGFVDGPAILDRRRRR